MALLKRVSSRKIFGEIELMSGNLLLLVTFIISISTSIATILIMTRLGLTSHLSPLELSNQDQNIEKLIVNQDFEAKRLSPRARLTIDSIVGRDIRLTASKREINEPRAEIMMNEAGISMLAQSFILGDKGTFSFQLPSKLESLEAPNGLEDIKLIRGPRVKNPPDENYNNENLSIVSDEELELSGNMGLSIHSNDLEIISPKLIELESREGSISIMPGLNGLRLASLAHLPGRSTSEYSRREQICIRKESGMLFKSASLCTHGE